MIKIIAWLAGSKLGRWIAVFVASAASVIFIILRAVSYGKSKERMKQREARYKAIKTKVKNDEKMDSLSRDDRRRKLSEWVRD